MKIKNKIMRVLYDLIWYVLLMTNIKNMSTWKMIKKLNKKYK